jgi:hypothetical protein
MSPGGAAGGIYNLAAGNMTSENYPALFRSADEASDRKQSLYLMLIRCEYLLLFVAAVISTELFESATFYLFYAFIFVLSICLLLARAMMKPEQDWYHCRALAESVKTLTWRYVMQAQPFLSGLTPAVAQTEFIQHLQRTLDENRSTAEEIEAEWSDQDQITPEMQRLRSLTLEERKAVYLRDRVKEQRSWYNRKAISNKKLAKMWIGLGVFCYVAAIALVLSRIRFTDWHYWPIEPIIVLASSIIGWMQIKKFNELGAAYTVAAHEIGLIAPRILDVSSDKDLSACVNEAELAFSREHTMWIARQSN